MNRRTFARTVASTVTLGAVSTTLLDRLSATLAAAGTQGASTAAPPAHYETMDDLINALAPTPAERARVMPTKVRHIAMLTYPGMFALDTIGPYSVLSGLMNTQVHLVWKDLNPVDATGIRIVPTMTLADCPKDLDVIMVPGGGAGTMALMKDPVVLDFLRDCASRATYVTSVCTGALVLGAAGLLKGYKATTHWVAHDVLPSLGAIPVRARIVEDRNRVTAAGVSAGIDFGLALAAKLSTETFAKALQLNIEYDPQPPFHAGSPDGAGEPITGAMRAMYEPIVALGRAAAKG